MVAITDTPSSLIQTIQRIIQPILRSTAMGPLNTVFPPLCTDLNDTETGPGGFKL